MAIPDLTPVKSSNIEAIGHDGKALFVRFKGKEGAPGPVWRYPTATQQDHDQMLRAESVGSHFHAHIKSKHAGERMP